MKDYLDIGSNYRQYNHSSWKSNAELQNEARHAGFHIKKHFIHREWKINWLMREKGFRVALFNDSSVEYARHVGGGRHVKDEKGVSPFD